MPPVAPQLTITGTIYDIFGNVDAGSGVVLQLCNYGPNLPYVAGSNFICKTRPLLIPVNGTTGLFTTKIYGNDVIVPAGTYYTLSVLDEENNRVQTQAYKFVGSGTVDVSTLTPYQPTPVTPVVPILYQTFDYWQIALTGPNAAPPGSTYTLSHGLSTQAPMFMLFYNGNLQRPGVDYTVSGVTITLNGWSTQLGDNLMAVYNAASVVWPVGPAGGPYVAKAGDTMTGPLTIDVPTSGGQASLAVVSDTGAVGVAIKGTHTGADLSLFDLGAPTDEKHWAIDVTTDTPADLGHGQFTISCIDDAQVLPAGVAIKIPRIGDVPQSVIFPVGITPAKMTDSASSTGTINQVVAAQGDGTWKWTTASIYSYGTWNSNNNYTTGNIVNDGGLIFICIATVSRGASHPINDAAHWTIISAPVAIGFDITNGTAGTNVGPYRLAPRIGALTKCALVAKAADGAVALTFRINKNGTNVFSTNPTLAAGATTGVVTSYTLSGTSITVAANDIFTIDILSGSANWQFTAQLT